MTNEQIIDKVVEMHFKNEDWKGYLKKQVKKSVKFKELLQVFSEVNIKEIK